MRNEIQGVLGAQNRHCAHCRLEREPMNHENNFGRNAEHYADQTPAAAMRNICRDEYQKEAARLDRIGDIVPLLRQMADIAGFEIIGRIPLRDKATGKEYR